MAARKNIPTHKKSPPSIPAAEREQVNTRIQLETIYSVVATVVSALEANNADRDADFATCLTRCVLTPLAGVMDWMETAKGGKAVQP